MKRRDFLRLTALVPLYVALPSAWAATRGPSWRTFDLTYEVDLTGHQGEGSLWLPLPQDAEGYQRVLSVQCSSPVPATLHWDETYHAPILRCVFPDDMRGRTLTVRARVATRDRDSAASPPTYKEVQAAAFYLQPTKHMPVDGIVRDTALRITRGVRGADPKARAIYEWVVENTFRDPKTRGCGLGDIKSMLESGNLGGKCADINSLFVGLARAAGIPAREFYGVRVAESKLFKSLGKAGDVSKAQHCRAEYFSPRRGWVAVDPADVRKAVLEEKLPLSDPRIVELRKHLFGHWEMNWVGFNHGRDFTLPGGGEGPLLHVSLCPFRRQGDRRARARGDEVQADEPGDRLGPQRAGSPSSLSWARRMASLRSTERTSGWAGAYRASRSARRASSARMSASISCRERWGRGSSGTCASSAATPGALGEIASSAAKPALASAANRAAV